MKLNVRDYLSIGGIVAAMLAVFPLSVSLLVPHCEGIGLISLIVVFIGTWLGTLD